MFKEILENNECRKAASLMEEIVACKQAKSSIPEYCGEAIKHINKCERCSKLFGFIENNPEFLED